MLCSRQHSARCGPYRRAGHLIHVQRLARRCTQNRTVLPTDSAVEGVQAKLERLSREWKSGSEENVVEELARWHEISPLLEVMADAVLAEEVFVYNTTHEPLERKQVLRARLFEACASEESLHRYLKGALGVADDKSIRVTWGSHNAGGEMHEVIKEYPLAYTVGRARCWFVEEL